MRIVAGTLKNRRIKSREGRETRPTLERIKEAIFSIIGEKVADAKFLDLYSGTGNVSFEALSRGAKRAIMIEEDKEALRVIIENVNHLGVEEKCRAYKNDVFRAIEILSSVGLVSLPSLDFILLFFNVPATILIFSSFQFL